MLGIIVGATLYFNQSVVVKREVIPSPIIFLASVIFAIQKEN